MGAGRCYTYWRNKITGVDNVQWLPTAPSLKWQSLNLEKNISRPEGVAVRPIWKKAVDAMWLSRPEFSCVRVYEAGRPASEDRRSQIRVRVNPLTLEHLPNKFVQEFITIDTERYIWCLERLGFQYLSDVNYDRLTLIKDGETDISTFPGQML